MLHSLRALLAFAMCSALLVAAQASPKRPADIPVAEFFKTAAVSSPVLSPDGKRVALLVPTPSGRKGLAVAEAKMPLKFIGISQFDDADVADVAWVNNERLIFTAGDFDMVIDDMGGAGLYAINADGSDRVWLIERDPSENKVGRGPINRPHPFYFKLVGTLRDGSNDVVVTQPIHWSANENETATMRLSRLDTLTRGIKPMTVGGEPRSSAQWLLDRDAKPRVVLAPNRDSTATVHWLNEKDEWVALTTTDLFNPSAEAWSPIAVDFDGTLFVTALENNPAKTSALYRFDPRTRKRSSEPLVNLKGFDFVGRVYFDHAKRRAVGVGFTSDAPGQVWFDADMKAVQASVDKQLPNTVNMIHCGHDCASAPRHVITAVADRQPPIYFLHEKATGALSLLAAAQPWLDAKLLATVEHVRFKARDGMEIPLYYTKPQGKGPFPTVALVHGGPFVRGHEWGFDREAQFLAARGYLVLEVDFRGSEGYGQTHQRAGWKQWGLAMQDDVTDATRWAIAQGLADPKRIAIAGGSYGGYATMMGLVKEPELYKAGVNIVGVTDIELMYEVGWGDFFNSKWMRYGMPMLVGDPKNDAKQLTQTSPLKRAAEIKQPVLMAYGEKDFRVPLPHGTRMRDALLKAGNKNVELIVYEGEGHGFGLLKNKVDFYTRFANFLDQHLKP